MVEIARTPDGKFIKRTPTDAGTAGGAVQSVAGQPQDRIALGNISLDPASADRAGDVKRETGKRGRPPGGRNKPKEKAQLHIETPGLEAAATLTDLSELNTTLQFSHEILSTVFRAPELKLDNDSADTLADALKKVNRHYNIKVKQKTLDWYNMIVCCAVVYGPRINAISMRRSSERAAKKRAPEAKHAQGQAAIQQNVAESFGLGDGRVN